MMNSLADLKHDSAAFNAVLLYGRCCEPLIGSISSMLAHYVKRVTENSHNLAKKVLRG